jgi:thioredoxin
MSVRRHFGRFTRSILSTVVRGALVLALAVLAALANGGGPASQAVAPAGPALAPRCGGAPPPTHPVWVSDRKFKKVVLKAEVPVLVEFGAVWCVPCRKMVPTLESLAADFAGRALIARVDIDDDPYLAQDLGVVDVPTLLLFDDGRLVRRTTGNRSPAELRRLLDETLTAVAPAADVGAAPTSARGSLMNG